jgi:acetyl esterase/lipase
VPLDPHAKRLLDMLAAVALREGPPITAAQRRQAFRNLMRMSAPAAPPAETADATCPGPGGPIPLRYYAPPGGGQTPLPALVYFHGGGFVAGSLDTHDALCRTLAVGIGCRIVAVGYRLGPEHRHPAAIEDGAAALNWIAANAATFGIAHDRLGVAGDSAGGGLAAVIAAQAGDDAGPPLALQLLLCPLLDLAGESPSRREFAEGFFLDAATIARDMADYCAGEDPRNPLLSPLRAGRFDRLPPTFIYTAEFDPLRDEGAAYATALAGAGVPVRHACRAGMIHHFYGLGAVVPAARTALGEICEEVSAALKGNEAHAASA